MSEKYDIVRTIIENKFIVLCGILFTVLVPIYTYFASLNTITLFLYVLSLLIFMCLLLVVSIIWIKNIGSGTDKLLSLTDGRLHLILSTYKIKLESNDESLEQEEPFYRSYGFTVAILNERQDIVDVEFIITKPPEVNLDFDYSKIGSILLESSNQIIIKMNIEKGVKLITIQAVEITNSDIASFANSSKLVNFEIKSVNFRDIPISNLCFTSQVVIQVN